MRQIISVLLENQSGALSRVVGLFSARGYNIDSLCVSVTEDSTLSRLIIVTTCHDFIIEQIMKKLNTLIEVVKVVNLNKGHLIERELLLLKVVASAKYKDSLFKLVEIYKARIIDISIQNYIIELTESKNKIDSFIETIGKENIVESVRTGSLGIIGNDNYI